MTATDPSPPPPSQGARAADENSSAKGRPPSKRAPRIIRRKKRGPSAAADALPAHIANNTQLHHVISTTLPKDYEFEIPKTIWRIEKANASAVALQLPEGLLMYASAIGDILIKFAYRFQPPSRRDGEEKEDKPKEISSLSILGDVTYGACCIDDLSARALGCDLLVHYGHSCLVPLTCTVIPCLYVFVEIIIDVQHLVDCVKLTFSEEEKERKKGSDDGGEENGSPVSAPARIIEALVMGTVQFRSAVVDSAQRLNSTSSEVDRVQFQAIVPQAKPLSPGEVLGCTAPSGLAQMDFQEALSKTRRRQARKSQDASAIVPAEATNHIPRERVMIFLADGRFHLEAAMISNPSLRALRYDPYAKSLTEERYEIVKMKNLRRNAILSVRRILGIHPPNQRMDIISGKTDPAAGSSDDIADSVLRQQVSRQPSSGTQSPLKSSSPITMGIILGTLGRQGNPAILSRIRLLLRSRGIRSVIILLSEIMPKKLEMMSSTAPESGDGVSAWVQIACPRLSIDWGHYFCVPVLSPFELFVALGEVADPSLWAADEEKEGGIEEKKIEDGYPMDFYSKSGGPWANYYDSNRERKATGEPIEKQ